jgi:methylmalonyl-CoA mutase N-terminal domain/subunit
MAYDDLTFPIGDATRKTPEGAAWKTVEQIEVKPRYTPDDLRKLEHLGYPAGIPPFLRGPYATITTISSAPASRRWRRSAGIPNRSTPTPLTKP